MVLERTKMELERSFSFLLRFSEAASRWGDGKSILNFCVLAGSILTRWKFFDCYSISSSLGMSCSSV